MKSSDNPARLRINLISVQSRSTTSRSVGAVVMTTETGRVSYHQQQRQASRNVFPTLCPARILIRQGVSVQASAIAF
jgi:hypothetical protein